MPTVRYRAFLSFRAILSKCFFRAFPHPFTISSYIMIHRPILTHYNTEGATDIFL
jgi:hypothetical protein